MSVQLAKTHPCPSWCHVTADEHAVDLVDLEGLLIHQGGAVFVRWSTTFDTVLGRPDDDQPARISVNVHPDMSVPRAKQLITELQTAVAAVEQVIGHE